MTIPVVRVELRLDLSPAPVRRVLRTARRVAVSAGGPVVLFLAFVASAGLADPFRAPEVWAWLVAYIVPPLGKETVIPALVAGGFHPLLVASWIAGIDLLAGLFFVWNYDRLAKVPRVGPLLGRAGAKASEALSRSPLVHRTAFVGLLLFHLIPFQGAGAVTTSILGRMMGFRPYRVYLAVAVGSVATSLLVAFAAYSLLAVAGRVALVGVIAAVTVTGAALALRSTMTARRVSA